MAGLITYNALGQNVKTVYPDTARDSMVYDTRGSILRKFNIKTDTLYKAVYEYDPQDHLSKVKEYRAPNDSATFDSTMYAYNLHGRLVTKRA